jgi:hypothetical protein
VTTKRLNEQVKRNAARFPADFIFRLTPTETVALKKLTVHDEAIAAILSVPKRRPIGFTADLREKV